MMVIFERTQALARLGKHKWLKRRARAGLLQLI
jgi:hypothetical protein